MKTRQVWLLDEVVDPLGTFTASAVLYTAVRSGQSRRKVDGSGQSLRCVNMHCVTHTTISLSARPTKMLSNAIVLAQIAY